MPVLRLVRGLAAALALTLAALAPGHAADGSVTVMAAASLKTALDDIVKQQGAAGPKVVVSYAASSALAKQIEQGAPADIFVSADLDWMDYLAKKNLIKADTRENLLGNRIVLVAPADKAGAVKDPLASPAAFGEALAGGRLAMGDVAAVPAGKYGKAALEKLGLWDGVKDHVAQAENVRAALALVARGEAPLGIVYETDAAAEPGVKVVARFPESSHPSIIYPAAVLAGSTSPQATAFLAHLRDPAAVSLFQKQGFTVLP